MNKIKSWIKRKKFQKDKKKIKKIMEAKINKKTIHEQSIQKYPAFISHGQI